jgi:hypothetical protein
MRIVKASNGATKIKISRRDWKSIGRKAGWIKTAFKDQVELGPTPPEEDCVQVGEENYRRKAIEECRRYIDLIRKKMGSEPEGARLKITSNPHDFGTYHEVACEFDEQFPKSVDYAFACESSGPQTWDDITPVNIEPSEQEKDLSEKKISLVGFKELLMTKKKITLSRNKWEEIGKKAGWIKVSQTEDAQFFRDERNESPMGDVVREHLNMDKKLLGEGDTVKLKDNVLQEHARSVPPHMGYTTQQFKWRDTLRELKGQIGVITRVFPNSNHVNVQFGDTLIGIDLSRLESASNEDL